MPELPLLNLPEPEPFDPRPGPRGGASIAKPGRGRQQERLGPRFERLMAVAGDPQELLDLRNDPASIAPERAIVFELAGSLKDFYVQARDLGLEYLGDFEDEIEPGEDFFDPDDPASAIAGRIYLAMPDVRALQELLSLWQRYTSGQNMPRGKGPWRELFSMLVDVRPWGPQDRVPPETVAYWQDTLAHAPDAPVRFEVELWFYENAERRSQAFERLRHEIEALGGTIVHHAVMPEIRYDAALIDMPGGQVQSLIDHPDVTLARVDEIMFLRPQSIARHPAKDELEGENMGANAPTPAFITPEPLAALLDGLPIQNHARLAGRLIVDDPDNLEPAYPIDRREHGTGMASLIIHGDLSRGEVPIPRPLFVRPVMQPDGHGSERTPGDRLLVDVLYRAVRRMKEGDADSPATAASVALINLSICDGLRPFARMMSPLGRLLDYLSNRYRVLFLVSAGNILDRIPVPAFQNAQAFEAALPEDREREILSALNSVKSQRTLLSPAEAVNAITVGASHAGSGFNGGFPANLIDPFTDEELPNIASAMGLGFRKVVKPEILFEGGRAPVRVVSSGGGIEIAPARSPARLFGARVAAPNRVGGTQYEDYIWGTSVATALATRSAHLIHDVLADAAGGSNHTGLPPEFTALILKALLVHGAGWGLKGAVLDAEFQPQGTGSHHARRDDISRLLGYGVPKIDRVLDCAANRATLLGYGSVAPGGAMLYRIPIPEDLEGVAALRSLTVTLAWFSPVNPRHQGYRMAALDVSAGSDEKYWIASGRHPHQPTDKAVARGTVFHERRFAENAAVFVDDGNLLIRVSCRATAGAFTEAVPYALAVSFEVAAETGIPVYEQIRARLAARVQAGINAGT